MSATDTGTADTEFLRPGAQLDNVVESNNGQLIHGVAIGKGDTTVGQSGIKKFWPSETLKEAAESLVGTPLVTDHTENVSNTVGRVTKAAYRPGIGVLYQAKLFEDSIAKKIANELLEVSIAGTHENVEEMEENDEGALVVEKLRFKHLSIVPRGAAGSNTLDVGPSSSLSELSTDVGITEELADESDMSVEELRNQGAEEPVNVSSRKNSSEERDAEEHRFPEGATDEPEREDTRGGRTSADEQASDEGSDEELDESEDDESSEDVETEDVDDSEEEPDEEVDEPDNESEESSESVESDEDNEAEEAHDEEHDDTDDSDLSDDNSRVRKTITTTSLRSVSDDETEEAGLEDAPDTSNLGKNSIIMTEFELSDAQRTEAGDMEDPHIVDGEELSQLREDAARVEELEGTREELGNISETLESYREDTELLENAGREYVEELRDVDNPVVLSGDEYEEHEEQLGHLRSAYAEALAERVEGMDAEDFENNFSLSAMEEKLDDLTEEDEDALSPEPQSGDVEEEELEEEEGLEDDTRNAGGAQGRHVEEDGTNLSSDEQSTVESEQERLRQKLFEDN